MSQSGPMKSESDPLKDMEALKHDDEPMPLFMGKWSVSPKTIFRVIIGFYVAFFAIHRIADCMYLMTVDARFPEGLGYLYPSEHERQQSIAYTRETIFASMCSQTVTFITVLLLLCTTALAVFDDCLRSCISKVCNLGGDGGPFQVVGKCLGGCTTWAFKGCWMRCCCGWMPNWGRLFRGAIFLTLISALFYLIHVPFKLWNFDINVRFGFINTLTITQAMYQSSLYHGFFGVLKSSAPQFFLYLLVLSNRFGWVLMWAGLITMSVVAQYNMGALAPQLFNAKNPFPNTEFGVGRDMPLVNSVFGPMSLNRLYFEDPEKKAHLITQDLSKGAWELSLPAADTGKESPWVIKGQRDGKTVAETQAEFSFHDNHHDLEKLDRQSWRVGGEPAGLDARVGSRKGKQLRDELFGFAKERDIGVGQVYMIDGSHQDARANAFVAGAGKERVIGLYDTLFLGDTKSQSVEPEENPPSSAEGGLSIFALSEKMQAVDMSEEGEHEVWHSTPTQAMSDDEIMAILAHELGHAAMHDVEQNMIVQAVTSFMTFGTLGWMVQSPLLAMSMGLLAPIGHIAVFAYEHAVGPSLDMSIKFVTDGITRRKEYVADAYAAKVSETYATGLQTALAKLVVNSNQDPDEPWFYEALHADHPTLANRWANIAKVKKELYPPKEEAVAKETVEQK